MNAPEILFWAAMVLVVVDLVVLPLGLLVMHFAMPKVVLERYWRAPHFRPAELAFFTGTVYAPMRTIMLMWALAVPTLGKKRGVEDLSSLVPNWYRRAAIGLQIWVVSSLLTFMAILVGLRIYGSLVE